MSIFIHLLYFSLFWGFNLLAGYLLRNGTIESTTALLLSTFPMAFIGLKIYGNHLSNEWIRLKYSTTIGKVFKLSLILFFLNAIVRIVLLKLLANWINMDTLGQNQQNLNELQVSMSPIFFIVATAIIAPFVEELVFREALNGWVKYDNKILMAIMATISTLFFAAGHVYTLQDFIIYLPMAISMIWIYYKYSRNVWASIIYHFVNNSIAVVLMYLIQFIPQEIIDQAEAGITILFK